MVNKDLSFEEIMESLDYKNRMLILESIREFKLDSYKLGQKNILSRLHKRYNHGLVQISGMTGTGTNWRKPFKQVLNEIEMEIENE